MRLAAVALALVLLAGCAGGPGGTGTSTSGTRTATGSGTATGGGPQPIHLFFDFGGEQAGPGDLSGWTAKADVPADPNNPGHKVAWNVTACDDAGYEDHVHIRAHPVHSACFFLDGRQDDGTVWISRAVPLAPGVSYQANVTVRAFGEESFNTVADLVMRLAGSPALYEANFSGPFPEDAPGLALREPLDRAAGWSPYTMSGLVGGPPAGGILYLDVGISAIWETEMTRYLDHLTVDLVPA